MPQEEDLEDLDPPEDERVLELLQSIDGRLQTLAALMERMVQGLTALLAAEGVAEAGVMPGADGTVLGGALVPLNLDALDGLGD